MIKKINSLCDLRDRAKDFGFTVEVFGGAYLLTSVGSFTLSDTSLYLDGKAIVVGDIAAIVAAQKKKVTKKKTIKKKGL